jgi:hypothetical protein
MIEAARKEISGFHEAQPLGKRNVDSRSGSAGTSSAQESRRREAFVRLRLAHEQNGPSEDRATRVQIFENSFVRQAGVPGFCKGITSTVICTHRIEPAPGALCR